MLKIISRLLCRKTPAAPPEEEQATPATAVATVEQTAPKPRTKYKSRKARKHARGALHLSADTPILQQVRDHYDRH